jgi:hypothetical protein
LGTASSPCRWNCRSAWPRMRHTRYHLGAPEVGVAPAAA